MAIFSVTDTTVSAQLNLNSQIGNVQGSFPSGVIVLFLSTLHEVVMKAWEQFAETRRKIALDSNRDYEVCLKHRAELWVQKRHIEQVAQRLIK